MIKKSFLVEHFETNIKFKFRIELEVLLRKKVKFPSVIDRKKKSIYPLVHIREDKNGKRKMKRLLVACGFDDDSTILRKILQPVIESAYSWYFYISFDALEVPAH